MVSKKSEDNTRLRARQIQRLHHKNTDDSPMPNAKLITAEHLRLAGSLEPTWQMDKCSDAVEYELDWTQKPRSMASMLTAFAKSAQALERAGQGLPVVGDEDEGKGGPLVDVAEAVEAKKRPVQTLVS